MKAIFSKTMLVALAVAITATIGAASMAVAANGKPFILGKNNVATAITKLVKKGSGPALDIRVGSGPPLRVNSQSVVPNLNSDKLDGKGADQLVRVASFTGPSPLANGASGTVATTSIIAPAPGFLVIDAGTDLVNRNESGLVTCKIEVNDVFARGSQRFMELDGAANVNEDEDCSTNTVAPVAAGTHTVDLVGVSDGASTDWGDTALSAIYIPFDGTGASPSSAAITAAQEEASAPENHK